MEKTKFAVFTQRGGWWVLAQVPVLLLAMLLPRWTAAGPFDPHAFLSLVGALLTALGFILTLVGLFSLGSSLTPFPRPLEHGVLRRRGVYASMRHPVYTGHLHIG